MEHDFDKKHKGNGEPDSDNECNTKDRGLMSYGEDRPEKWSSCSHDDLKEWFETHGHACSTIEYKGKKKVH